MKRRLPMVLSLLALATLVTGVAHAQFVHGIVIEYDGENWYLSGPPDGPNGERDIPGHAWVHAGPDRIRGKHYNTGPFGATKWWSSDAPDGEYLYNVDGIIDDWSPSIAQSYAKKGYIHYHELVKVSNGSLHPTKVVWLKHIARTSFTLDGGPAPEFAHDVRPGIDYEFIPIGMNPYNP